MEKRNWHNWFEKRISVDLTNGKRMVGTIDNYEDEYETETDWCLIYLEFEGKRDGACFYENQIKELRLATDDEVDGIWRIK